MTMATGGAPHTGSRQEMERNPEIPASIRDEALFIAAAMLKESRGAPRNAKGDLTP